MSIDNQEIIVKVEEDIFELIPGFLENRKKNLVTIKSAVTDQDFELIYQTAHKIKGSAALYGFIALSDMAKEIESAGRNEDMSTVKEFLAKAENHLPRLKVEKGA
jgi:HPt (histidine-containing phosphotransfer) domain-containing protein